jgi:hypothetical protein
VSYFVPHKPTSGEASTYNRRPVLFDLPRVGVWQWRFAQGYVLPAWPALRAVVDGAPHGDWVTSTDGFYAFAYALPDGHHIFNVEGLPPGVECLQKGFVINESGAPLTEQNPWIYRTRFEVKDHALAAGAIQVEYAPRTPTTIKLKPRTIIPFSERLSKKDLWSGPLQAHTAHGFIHAFVRTKHGDFVIAPEQKYFYADVQRSSNQLPPLSLFDGPRGVGDLGYLYSCIISPGGTGFYFSDVHGRIGFCRFSDGNVITIAGWRNKPGEPRPHGQYQDTDPTFYYTGFELVGDWSQVPDGLPLLGTKKEVLTRKGFRECWQMVALPDPRTPTSFHEFLVCDTMNHRILYINHWTAHDADHYEQPLYAPTGYVAPDAPTGQSQVAVFLDAAKLGMTGPCPRMNEPWGIAVHPSNGRVYWSNFGNGNIASANLDSTDVRLEIRSTKYPSNATLRLNGGRRLYESQIKTDDTVSSAGVPIPGTRTLFNIDGFPTVHQLCRPQAMAFNSSGLLHWVERYTFVLRTCNLETKEISTLANFPQTGGTDFGQTDVNMVIDTEGTFGPKGDIFTMGWHRASYRFAKDGTYLGRPWSYEGVDANALTMYGPLNGANGAGYAWGIGVAHGMAVIQGNAGGWQSLRITKRLPTDPEPDRKKYVMGANAYAFGSSPPMALSHGAEGQGRLGFKNLYELGALADPDLRAYGVANGIPEVKVDAWIYWVRFSTVDLEYATQPVDTEPPAAPLFDLHITVG